MIAAYLEEKQIEMCNTAPPSSNTTYLKCDTKSDSGFVGSRIGMQVSDWKGGSTMLHGYDWVGYNDKIIDKAENDGKKFKDEDGEEISVDEFRDMNGSEVDWQPSIVDFDNPPAQLFDGCCLKTDIDILKTTDSGDLESWWIYYEDDSWLLAFASPNGGVLYCENDDLIWDLQAYEDKTTLDDYIDSITWGATGKAIAAELKKYAGEIWDDYDVAEGRQGKIEEKLKTFVESFADENVDWCAEVYAFE